jgi:hypothetical protein
MNVVGTLGAATIALGVVACSPTGEPTHLSVPDGAVEVRQTSFAGGRAHQTDFTLKVNYPDNRALHHYIKVVPAPWIRCDWAPTWGSHLDGTQAPVRTVHQQLHMWVNREAKRALLLSMRYYSDSDCAPKPLNDDQEVVVVEYMGIDVDDHIKDLQLKCPAKEVRSNSTLHPDAREVPSVAKSCGARAGERGR